MLNESLMSEIRNALKPEPKIIAAYVLGSYVFGKETGESDFDLAVVVESRKDISFDHIYNLLSEIKFPKDLDLSVVDRSSSPLFLFQAINGRCAYARSGEDRGLFEASIAENYYDTAHMRKIYYSHLKEKFPYAG
ncbi:MAG: nucleotidyltransferase domain-containing protein [Patescibacteria group bacterium]